MNFIKVMSYNIWFEDILENDRINSLIDLINSQDPDIICLQEVKPYIHEYIKKKLSCYNYVFPNKIEKNYGCSIYSKYKFSECTVHRFKNSRMGRELLIAGIKYTDKKIDIIVANSHFESLFKRTIENSEKLEQYKESQKILENLYSKHQNVIFCSDTNLLDIEEDKFFPNGWKDCWKEKGNNVEYTYDGKNNLYLQMRKIPFRSRLDRIIYKSVTLICEEYKMLTGADTTIEPSDHFGIQGKFEINLNE